MMKRLILIIIPASVLIFFSCQKEISFETGVNAPATGTLKDSMGDCDSMTVNGTYTENQALTSSNTITVTVNITGAGSYRVFTDTVNGFSFVDSGFFATPGTYQINLKGKGTPILPIATDFIVSFGTSFCSVTVDVQPGMSSGSVNSSDTAWNFNEGALQLHGHVDSALAKTTGGIGFLNIYGKPATNDTTFYVQLQLGTPGTAPSGTYSTSAGTAVFEFKTPTGSTIYDSRQTDGSNLVFTVIAYNTSTKILEAIFSGTVKDGSGGTKTVSSGNLKIEVQ